MRVIRLVLVAVALTVTLSAASAFGVSPSPRLLEIAKSDPTLAEQPSFIDPEIGSDIDVATVDRIVIAPNEFGIPEASVEFAPATSGTLRTLAILVRPADKTAQVLPSAFDALLFADVSGPASLRGYYREVSYGALDLTTSNMPSSVGWIGLPENLSYYAGTANGIGAWPNNAQKMVADAVAAADSAIDFSVYDNDHDGFVDNLIVIHAGRGAEYTGASGDIWSHSWALNANAVTVDGVTVNGYTTEPEYWVTPGDMTTGVFAHELGHVFGLPDLYDRTPEGTPDSEGIGNWSLMASGNWNGPGGRGGSASRPDAWSALQLGWVAPTNITSGPTATSVPAVGSASTGTVFRIYPNGASNGPEYFLVENRQKTGTDSYLPGPGMLVWHVDETQAGVQNDDETHKLVDLEEADGLNHLDTVPNRGDTGDPYPGSTSKTAFNNSSTPNSRTYAGVDSRVTITGIGSSQTTMTALMGIAFNYTLNYSAGVGGTIVGTASQTVAHGSSGTTVTAFPDTGYTFTGWSDGTLTAARRETNVTANKSVTANFTINSYTLDFVAGTGGTIVGAASQTVTHGSSGTTVTAAANTGYTFTSWSDGTLTAARRETNVTADHTITATFAINTYVLAYEAGPGGSIEGSATQVVDYDSSGSSVTATPSAGYRFVEWSDESTSATRIDIGVRADATLTASFAFIPVAGRVTGGSRYEVATNLARMGWDSGGAKAWSGVRHIIIANGEPGKEADPLTAAALAGVYDAPVLLVQAASIPAVTRAVITEIAASRRSEDATLAVHIIGGVNSVPDARWTEISKIAGVSGTKDRIAGRDRYAVSASIAERVIVEAAKRGKPLAGVILIAADNPSAFYDALAASPVAFARTMPMLAVQKAKVPSSVASILATTALVGQKRYASSSSAYIMSGLFSDDVPLTTSSNRYTAAADIAEFAVTQSGITSDHTGLTAKLSDALTGGTYLGKTSGVLLFTDSSSKIQIESRLFIQAQKSSIAHGWIIGGPISVPEGQLIEFRNLLK